MVGAKRRIRLVDQGHLPLPTDLLQKHHLQAGDEVILEEADAGMVITPQITEPRLMTEQEPFVLAAPTQILYEVSSAITPATRRA